jgi:hypothetical protein
VKQYIQQIATLRSQGRIATESPTAFLAGPARQKGENAQNIILNKNF